MRRIVLCAAMLGLVTLGVAALVAQTHAVREDCTAYTASDLRLVDRGDRGWELGRNDGAIFMTLDTRQDADTLLTVFKAHSAFCYVGRDNRRRNRSDYVYHYWK